VSRIVAPVTAAPATPDARTLADTRTLPDTTDYAAIHRSIRSAGYAIARAAETLDPDDHERMDAFVRYWQGHAGEILSHHGVEDDIFFPALLARAPETAEVLAELDAEHHLLDRLMEECRQGIEGVVTGDDPAEAARRLHRLADVMDDHLDIEDREVVPLFAAHFTGAEYAELTKAAIKQVGFGKQAAFTVPYVGYWATEADRVALLSTAPLPFRVLYRLTRNRHGRLTALALRGAV
jgi:hemerythrin-like domain-containing protein